VLSGDPYQSHTVSADDAVNTVVFEYVRGDTASTGTLTVLGKSGDKVIYMTTSQVTVGEDYGKVTAPEIKGYKNGKWLNTSSPVDGIMTAGGATVTFTYDMDMVDVRIYVKDTNGNPLDSAAYEDETTNLHKTVQAQKGSDVTIYAPAFEGWVATGGVSYTYTDISANQAPVFTYKAALDGGVGIMNVVDVTIIGTNGAKELYHYVKRIAKSDLPYELKDGADVYFVPNYNLDSGQDHTVVLGKETYNFHYTSKDSTVITVPVDNNKPAPSNKSQTQGPYKSPRTGDAFSVLLWLAIASSALLGLLVGIAFLRRKKHNAEIPPYSNGSRER
jgi:LPXTG-motif cell wall-anchored protein